MNTQEKLVKQAIPCEEFLNQIQFGEYYYLFEELGAKVILKEEYDTPMGKSCNLLLQIDNLQIQFNSNPRDGNPEGTPIGVAVVGTTLTEKGWYSPRMLFDFLKGQWTKYLPNKELPDNLDTPEKRRRSIEDVVHFFSSGEYEYRKDEFEEWDAENRTQFMNQVYAYHQQ